MAIKYTKGDEPVPGYRLVEFLGRGGFGEVWKAMAPGRAEVALKIIALDQKQGMKEFKSLRLVKTVRHPNLVPINAFWLKDSSDNLLDDEQIDAAAHAATVPPDSHADNQVRGTMLASAAFNRGRPAELLIAMGLGEKNLFSRLQECQSEGRDGIAPDELLEYMDGSAKAIDFLNSRHNIQHCDIKPQNIMVVGGLAQVCDFGLARELGDARMTGGAGTIAYGAPELLWDNKASAGTDQYSLALTFYELRTGRLPFPEDSAQMAVMMAHRDGKLDLSGLSEDERAVIKRATSPDPTKRFAHCADMVRALRRAWGSASQLRPQTWVKASGEGVAAIQIEPGCEIVPGYTLVKQLFRGGSSEVWEATVGNNIPRALLIRDVSRGAASVDPNALALIQGMDHPHLTQVLNFWLLDDLGRRIPPETVSDQGGGTPPAKLVIAGKLATSNLLERLEECRKERDGGIPPDELIEYMYGVADAVDELNSPKHQHGSRRVAVQHCNLRPVNMLLYERNIVRVGNLARARVLDGDSLILPPNARNFEHPFCAPELADGELTRSCDQYALAVSYVQMRTAHSAFDAAASTSGLASHQRQGKRNLMGLGAREQLVIQRATAGKPEERFENCGAMVIALEEALRTDLADQNVDPPPPIELPPVIPMQPVDADVDPAQPHPTTGWEPGVSTGGKTATKTNEKSATLVEPLPIKRTPGPEDPQRLTEPSPKSLSPEAKAEEEPRRKPKRRRVKVTIKIVLLLCPLLIAAGIVGRQYWPPDITPFKAPETAFNKADAIARQEEWLSKDNYADALVEYQRLGKKYPGNPEVEKLGSDLFKSLQERVESLADAGQLTKAALVYQSCQSSEVNDDLLASAREALIERGSKWMADRLKRLALRDIKELVTRHRDLPERTRNAGPMQVLLDEVITKSVESADLHPNPGNTRIAGAIQDLLASLVPENKAVRELGKRIDGSPAPVPDGEVRRLLGEAATALDVDPPAFVTAKAMCDEAEAKRTKSQEPDLWREEIKLARARIAVRENSAFDRTSIDVTKLKDASDKALYHALPVLAAGGSADNGAERILSELTNLKAQPEALKDLASLYRWESERVEELHGEVCSKAIELAWKAPTDPKIRARFESLLRGLEAYGVHADYSDDFDAAKLYYAVSSPADFVGAMKKLDHLWSRMREPGVKALGESLAAWALADGSKAVLKEALAAVRSANRGQSVARSLEPLESKLEAKVTELALAELRGQFGSESAPDWDKLRANLPSDTGTKLSAFEAAAWVECLIEVNCPIEGDGKLAPADWGRGADLLKKNRPNKSNPDTQYFDYASALLLRYNPTVPDHDAAADKLVATFAEEGQGFVNRTYRKKRAINILLDAAVDRSRLDWRGKLESDARSILDSIKNPFSSADKAERIELWLSPAAKWIVVEPSIAAPGDLRTLQVNRAAAAHFRAKPDQELAGKLTDELLDENASPRPLALLINAEANAQIDPLKAIGRYEELFSLWAEKPAKGGSKLVAYTSLVEPALKLKPAASDPPSDAALSKRIARLWAAKGRLIQSDRNVELFVDNPNTGVVDAYERAVRFDGMAPEYKIEHGLARLDLLPSITDPTARATMLREIRETDVGPVFDGVMRPLPGAFALRANVSYWEAFALGGDSQHQKRIDAIDDFRAACADPNADPRFAWRASIACVQIANGEDMFTDTEKWLVDAEKFANSAERSKGALPRPHEAHEALGNALEDFGFLLGVNRYDLAIDQFDKAVELAEETGHSPALAFFHRGRCRFRRVQAGSAPAGKNEEELDRARKDLSDAIEDSSLPLARRAEACRWIADICVYRAGRPNAADSAAQYMEAETAMERAVELLGEAHPDWAKRQLYLARVTLTHADITDNADNAPRLFAFATERAQKVLDAQKPSTDERIQAWSILLDVYRDRAKKQVEAKKQVDVLAEGLKELGQLVVATSSSENGKDDNYHLELLLLRSEFIRTTELWTSRKDLFDSSTKEVIEKTNDTKTEEAGDLAARAHAEKGYAALKPTEKLIARIDLNPNYKPSDQEREVTRKALLGNYDELNIAIDRCKDPNKSLKWRIRVAKSARDLTSYPKMVTRKSELKTKAQQVLNEVVDLREVKSSKSMSEEIARLLREAGE